MNEAKRIRRLRKLLTWIYLNTEESMTWRAAWTALSDDDIAAEEAGVNPYALADDRTGHC